jgi:hypothetical protein
VKALHEFENVLCAPFVQIACRFVCKQQRWPIYQRSRDRHALLFAPGKFPCSLRDTIC